MSKAYLIDGTVLTEEEIGVTRDIPENRGVRNAYKRAHQLADIDWTALAVIPTNGSATGCSAGNHHGMLYSEALQFERYVPYGCSILTFMTAIHNPYSVMYTEDTKGTAARKKSAYGFDYLNTTLNGAFFGTVCSGFTSYALGLPLLWQTYDLAWLANDGIFEEVYDNTSEGLKLMDILWVSGHVQIVTDIYRNARGKPVRIFVSESTQNFVVTNERSAAYIDNYLKRGKIYRYKNLYKSLDYEPSPFVAVEDELLEEEYQYNDDICTYMGDCVSIADWEKMFINYTKGNYTNMELYKGNTLIQTITLPDSYNATHSIDVTGYLTGAGEYKARLIGNGINSEYTYFEVVDTNVSANLNGNDLTVTFSSTNSIPLAVRLKMKYGGLKATYVLTEEDKAVGYCVFDPYELRQKQGRSVYSEAVFARVVFQGKYNQVIGDYVDTHIV